MTCRLLYLLGQLCPGGQERQLYYLLKTMDRECYQPAIAVWNYTTRDELFVREIEKLGVPVYPCSDAASVPTKLTELCRLIDALQPEVVHSYCFYTNVVAWWATRRVRTIPIGSIRQDFVGEQRFEGLTLNVAGRLSACLPTVQICNSLAAKKAAEESFLKPRRLRVVGNGVDTETIISHPLPQEGRSLLAVGRLDPEKRWDRLLRAIGILAGRKFEFSLRLAGDGPLLSELQLQARQLGIDRLVQFLGVRHDIPSLLKDSLFLVHTADAEGCPNVVLEAMASGRAVISTDAGDVSHLIENGKTGFLVRRGDDLELAECMIRLLSDQDLCRSMGEAGRKKAKLQFGLGRLLTNTLEAYRAFGWNDHGDTRTLECDPVRQSLI